MANAFQKGAFQKSPAFQVTEDVPVYEDDGVNHFTARIGKGEAIPFSEFADLVLGWPELVPADALFAPPRKGPTPNVRSDSFPGSEVPVLVDIATSEGDY